MVLVTADLAAWLTQIWDEEERLAKAAMSPARRYLAADSGVWGTFHGGGIEDAASGDVIVYDEGTPTSEQADFIAAHDPASVLARIAADRKILAEHAASGGKCRTCCGEPYMEEFWDGETETVEWNRADLAWPCPTVLLLASPYADRPGFRSEWLVERQGVEG